MNRTIMELAVLGFLVYVARKFSGQVQIDAVFNGSEQVQEKSPAIGFQVVQSEEMEDDA